MRKSAGSTARAPPLVGGEASESVIAGSGPNPPQARRCKRHATGATRPEIDHESRDYRKWRCCAGAPTLNDPCATCAPGGESALVFWCDPRSVVRMERRSVPRIPTVLSTTLYEMVTAERPTGGAKSRFHN